MVVRLIDYTSYNRMQHEELISLVLFTQKVMLFSHSQKRGIKYVSV